MKINARTSLDIPIQSIQEFELYWKINDHAQMTLQGILEDYCDNAVCERNYRGVESQSTWLMSRRKRETKGYFLMGSFRTLS